MQPLPRRRVLQAAGLAAAGTLLPGLPGWAAAAQQVAPGHSGLSGASGIAGGAAFIPPQTASLQLWFKADSGLYQDSAGTIPATADADPVGKWTDNSGVGNHGLQTTNSKRATLKLAIQNGRPVLRFDGVDDFLALGTNVASLAITGNLTAFFVATRNNTGYGGVLAYQETPTVHIAYEFRYDTGASPDVLTGVMTDDWGGGGTRSSTGTLANGAFHVATAIRNSTNFKWFLDGAASGNYTLTGSPTTSTAQAGTVGARSASANLFLGGDIGEILLYSAALSTTNQQTVESYLRTRWGTP